VERLRPADRAMLTVSQFILSQEGWSYPPGSIVGKIFYVPLEEHLFFILQPIFLTLVHSIAKHSQLIPFRIPTASLTGPSTSTDTSLHQDKASDKAPTKAAGTGQTVQTLPRGTVVPAVWVGVMMLGALLVHEAHGLSVLPIHLGLGKHAFYMGWILIWISPVCAFLAWLGAQFGRAEVVALSIGTAWLWIVDT
jgi:15-cis-phytoene synthase/lycopene beta-cyclase